MGTETGKNYRSRLTLKVFLVYEYFVNNFQKKALPPD